MLAALFWLLSTGSTGLASLGWRYTRITVVATYSLKALPLCWNKSFLTHHWYQNLSLLVLSYFSGKEQSSLLQVVIEVEEETILLVQDSILIMLRLVSHSLLAELKQVKQAYAVINIWIIFVILCAFHHYLLYLDEIINFNSICNAQQANNIQNGAISGDRCWHF